MLRLLAFFSLFIISSSQVLGRIIYVDIDAPEGGNGKSWSEAYRYLQDALLEDLETEFASSFENEIWVAEGTYHPHQTDNYKNEYDVIGQFMVNGQNIYGGFSGFEIERKPTGSKEKTILSGEYSSEPIMNIYDWVSQYKIGPIVVSGFTVSQSNTISFSDRSKGGGIGIGGYGGNVRIEDVLFINNKANFGGAIYANLGIQGPFEDSGKLIIKNCTFQSNSAQLGGAVHIEGGTEFEISDCIFFNNETARHGSNVDFGFDGGAVQLDEGAKGIIENCSFASNVGFMQGGGIASMKDVHLQIFNSSFYNNSAGSGAAICFDNSGGTQTTQSLVSQCIFEYNTADYEGYGAGGIVIARSSSPLILNSIFLGNSKTALKVTEGSSPDIYHCLFTYNDNSIVFDRSESNLQQNESSIYNSIFWKNISFDDPSIHHGITISENDYYKEHKVNFKGRNIVVGWSGDGNIESLDPLFVDVSNPEGPDGIWFTQDDGLRLAGNSPAIDAAESPYFPSSLDLSTTNKVNLMQGTHRDIGPYEFPREDSYFSKLGTDLSAGWRSLDWFGSYFPTSSGWIYHIDHSWIYTNSETLDSVWFWGELDKWCWTNQTIYPWVWFHDEQSWKYYFKQTGKWMPPVTSTESDSQDSNNSIDNSSGSNSTSSFDPSSPPKTWTVASAAEMEMIWVEPGTFTMGSPTTESGRNETIFGSNETQHQVTLTQGFYLGKYEVTQAQYETVMTGNTDGLSATPSYFSNNPNRPVEGVSWHDIQVFLTRLNQNDSSNIPTGWAYVLPTEAQWEYACRAGTTTAYSWGDSISSSYANYNANIGRTQDVGQYSPNAWGFFDMHGNVWEWVADRWGFYYYGSNAVTDPTGPASGSFRVNRGGSWYNDGTALRSAMRSNLTPSTPSTSIGFRVGFQKVQ